MPQPSAPPARPTKDQARAARQAKARAAREAERRAEGRRTILLRSAIAVAVLALGAAITVAIVTAARPRVVALPTPRAASGTGSPPWAVPADPSAGISAAELSTSPMASGGAHFHPHLDIRVNGKAVAVPADIGISTTTGAMSELHSHDATGVLHIESAKQDDRYVLGQLFTEWGVRLDTTHLGGLTSGRATLSAYVDGKRFNGNPAEIELKSHREVALIYDDAGQQTKPPSRYTFAPGD